MHSTGDDETDKLQLKSAGGSRLVSYPRGSGILLAQETKGGGSSDQDFPLFVYLGAVSCVRFRVGQDDRSNLTADSAVRVPSQVSTIFGD